MAKVFAWLRPNDLVWNYWVNNYLLGENPPAFDILFWNNDTTRLPAGLHSDFLDLYLDQRSRRGHARRARHAGRPRARSCATPSSSAGFTDHIIPWDGAYRTTQLLGGASQFVLSNGGHIQAILNPPDNPKASYLTADELAATAAEWQQSRVRSDGDRGGRTGMRGSPRGRDRHGRAGDTSATRPTRRSIRRPDATSTCR